jgi:hypothetical protein
MKTRITVGEIDIRLDGHDLTHTQLRALIKAATRYALEINTHTKAENDEPATGSGIGFTAHLDLDPGRHEPPQAPWYDGEDETE